LRAEKIWFFTRREQKKKGQQGGRELTMHNQPKVPPEPSPSQNKKKAEEKSQKAWVKSVESYRKRDEDSGPRQNNWFRPPDATAIRKRDPWN